MRSSGARGALTSSTSTPAATLYARRADVARPARVGRRSSTRPPRRCCASGPTRGFDDHGPATRAVDADGRLARRPGPARAGATRRLLRGGLAARRQLTAIAGIRACAGRLLGDESLFDALRGSASTARRDTTVDRRRPRRPDRSRAAGPATADPPRQAARRLAKALQGAGVKVTGGAGAGLTPPGARPVAAASPRRRSRDAHPPDERALDNFLAETLLKDLGSRFGGAGTSAAGAAVVRAQARDLRRRARASSTAPGSRARTARRPRQVVALLAGCTPSPSRRSSRRSLRSRAGSGTIAGRMRGTAAAGPLPGEDRDAGRRERAGRALPGRRRPRDRLRLPHDRHVDVACPRGAEPPRGARRPLRRAVDHRLGAWVAIAFRGPCGVGTAMMVVAAW